MAAVAGSWLGGCSADEPAPTPSVLWDAGPGGQSAGGTEPGGGNGPLGGGGAHQGGAGAAAGAGGDLGWPFDTAIPEPCAPNPLDTSGDAWVGWSNLQHPAMAEATVGQQSEAIYGRLYAEGLTPAPGAAAGFTAELLIGPFGTLPFADGRCWSTVPATFNVDVGNDDEYAATATATARGLFALLYRFRPTGGAWRYGDLDGSDNGVRADEAALLVVREPSASPAPLVVATQNLRCRFDDWPTRRGLVVAALARVRPDLVAFQEDCEDSNGVPQSEEIRAELAPYLRHGFEISHVTTHLASDGGQQFAEGISVMSAHHVEAVQHHELPYVHFPRRALSVDVTVAGSPLRFYSTHFDYGADAAEARQQSAELLVASWPSDRLGLLGGDLNATPDEPGAATLGAALADLWRLANPSDPGLTMPAPEPTRRIDHLFASVALSSALRGAKILDENDAGVWLSDHRGMAAAVALPDRR